MYDSGPTLRYSTVHPVGEYGMLGDQPLDLIEFSPFEIEKDEFGLDWDKGTDPVTSLSRTRS